MPQNRWAYKLAPQLTGRAQQAYAAMPSEEAGDYALVKAAILQRYDISEIYKDLGMQSQLTMKRTGN